MKPSDLDWWRVGVDSWLEWWEWYCPAVLSTLFLIVASIFIMALLLASAPLHDRGTMGDAIRRAKYTLVLQDSLDCEQELKRRAPDFTYIPLTERAREPRPRVGDE